MDEHVEAPTTIKEVGIYIGWLRKDMTEMKKLLEQLPSGFASKNDVERLDKRITVLERARSKNWILNTASAGVGALLFFLIQYAITHPPQ